MSFARGPKTGSASDSCLSLEVDDVTVTYGERVVLDGFSLRLEGGITALVGVNGAGKSTLMRVIAGALKPATGHVRVGGSDPYQRSQRKAALSSLALMPQEARFPASLTATEVVAYLAWMRGLSGSQARSIAVEALEKTGLSERRDTKMGKLSGGMVRRVALAQALVTTPDLLILDEPSTGLDPQQRRLMVDHLKGLTGCVLISSHVMEDVVELAHRVIVLHAGRKLYDGSLTGLGEMAPSGLSAEKAVEAGFLSLVSAHGGRDS